MKNRLKFAFVVLMVCIFFEGYTQVPVNFKNPTSEDYINTNLEEYNMIKAKKMGFTENIGQLKGDDEENLDKVFFYSNEQKGKILITEKGISLFFTQNIKNTSNQETGANTNGINTKWSRIDILVENAKIKKENIETSEALPYTTNQYKTGLFTNIKTFGKLILKNILPGIDWVIYNNSKTGFKYDFIVHSGANLNELKLSYLSESKAELNPDGSLSVQTKLGSINESKPYSFLQSDSNIKISSSYHLLGTDEMINDNYHYFRTRIAFDIANYNETETLIIDPTVSWNYNFDANDESYNFGITKDENDNIYIVGQTYANNLPTLNIGGGNYYDGTFFGSRTDAYIFKFNSSGSLQWATYYGGNWDDSFTDITCNNSGRLGVVGHTGSSDPTCIAWGGAYFDDVVGGSAGSTNAGLILLFNYSGQLTWATTFGAGTTSMLNTCDFDSNNKLYVIGHSGHGGYPVVNLTGAYNTSNPPSGSGSGSSDLFIARFSATGVQEWGTWYGGSNSGTERPHTLEIDGSNNMYIGGFTQSSNFPCQNLTGAFPNQSGFGGGADGFIVKFNSSGARVWATYIGGAGFDNVNTIKIKGTYKYMTGQWGSTNFSTYTPFPSQPAGAFVDLTLNGTANTADNSMFGNKDQYLIKFNAADDIEWSTLLGGTDNEQVEQVMFQGSNIDINSCGSVFITFPTKTNVLSAGTNAGLPGLVCDAGYSNTSYENTGARPNYYIASFTSGGVLRWGTYYGEGAFANENPATLVVSNANDLFWISGRSQWPDLSLTKFTKRTLTINQGGVSSCSCTATVVPAGTCTGTFNYAWTGAGTGTGNVRSSLCNGNYSVTITDNIMCQTTPINFNVNNCTIIILPVEVINFNAQLNQNKTVDINWQTSSERNNNYFTIEKSIDGQNWELLANVKGSGSTNITQNYYLEDRKPEIGTNYYKLKQTDFDGMQKEIDIKTVKFSASGLYYLFPNPANNSVSLIGENLRDYSIKLFNNLGEQIYLSTHQLDESKIELNTSQLYAGVYFISLDNGSKVENLKLIIQK